MAALAARPALFRGSGVQGDGVPSLSHRQATIA
jgi:hypothetical protein